jgi:hypothetical protein
MVGSQPAMAISMTESELAVLCACARVRAQGPGIASVLDSAANVDWDALLAAADFHGVTDLLLTPLTSGSANVPARVVQYLENRQLEVTGLNLNRTTQLVAILRRLSEHGVPALTFKGPALAAGVYGHLGCRLSSDLDLLIHRRDLARLRQLLMADGYTLPARARHRAGSLAHGLFPAAGRDDTMLPGQRWQTTVDVHIAFAYWTLGIQFDTSDLFDRAVTVDVAGQTVATLCPNDLLLVLAIHGMMHGWAWLRFVSDIDACAAQVTDWDEVIRRAESARMSRVLRVALLLAVDVLRTALPADVVSYAAHDSRAIEIAREAAARMFDADAANGEWDPGPWQLSFMEGPRDRFRFHTRTLIYEWYLKWPWDQWLGRRDAKTA